jgi:hypothetical protein
MTIHQQRQYTAGDVLVKTMARQQFKRVMRALSARRALAADCGLLHA